MTIMKFFAAAALAASVLTPAAAADITGAGATFPFPLYAKWAEAYKAATGVGLNYQSIGSGGGIRQIKAKTIDFGATDMPLKGEDLARDGLAQFPAAIGGVTPVVHLDGVAPGQLKLTGPLLAAIYLGRIGKWNDKAIADLNPGLKLPDAAINVVYRSDGSGTTFVFADYLSRMSEEWKTKIGANTAVSWPVGVGGKGNEGVAASVKLIANSIGYVEFAFARQNRLAFALLRNREGDYPAPNRDAFQAAAASADWAARPGFGVPLNDQPGAQAWPMTSATFILIRRDGEAARNQAALKFFDWAYAQGDGVAAGLDYAPLPAEVKALVRRSWAQELKFSP